MKLVDIFNVKKVKVLNEMLETYKNRIDSKDCTINKLIDEKNELFDRLNLVNSEKRQNYLRS